MTVATQPSAKKDFRDAAVAASERVLAELARAQPAVMRDPFAAGMSLCLRVPGEGDDVRRQVKRRVVLCLILGGLGVLLGAGFAKLSESGRSRGVLGMSEHAVLAVAGLCSGTGFVLMIHGVRYGRRRARRAIAARLDIQSGTQAIDVEVEDASTYTVMKAVTEDLGVLLMYPAQQCVVIEGVTHRYLIYAADVTQLREVPGPYTTAVGIAYLAAGEPLDVTLKQQGVWAELRARMTPWSRNQLLKRIVAALGRAEPGTFSRTG